MVSMYLLDKNLWSFRVDLGFVHWFVDFLEALMLMLVSSKKRCL